MGNTAALKAKITLDNSGFHRGLRASLSSAKAFGGQMARAASAGLRSMARSGLDAGRALGAGIARGASLGLKTLGGAAGAAALGLSVGVKKAYDLGRSLRTLNEQTGILPGRLLIMQRAFEDSDLEADALGTSINKMQRHIEDAANGSGSAIGIFNRLGLSFSQLQQLTPDQQFFAIGRAINEIADPAERSNAAMELFGKSGGKFLALFGNGGAIISAARSLGLQARILDENSATFDAISVRFSRIGSKLQGFFVGVAERLAPVLLPLLDRLDRIDLAGVGRKVGDSLISGAQTLLGIINNPSGAIKMVVDGFTYGILSAGNVLIGVMRAARVYFQNGMMETILGLGNVLLGVLTKAFQTPIAYFQASVDRLLAKLPKALGGSGEVEDAKKRYDELSQEMEVLAGQMGANRRGPDHNGQKAWAAKQMQERFNAIKAEREKQAAIIENTVESRVSLMKPVKILAGGRLLSGDELIQQGTKQLQAGFARAKEDFGDIEVKDYLGAESYKASASGDYNSLREAGASLLKNATTPMLIGNSSTAYRSQLAEIYGKRKANEILYGKDEAEVMNKDLLPQVSDAYRSQITGIFGRNAAAQILTTGGRLPLSSVTGSGGSSSFAQTTAAALSGGSLGSSGGLYSPHLGDTGGLGGGAYHVVRRGDHQREKERARQEEDRSKGVEETNTILSQIKVQNDQMFTLWRTGQ